MKTDLMNKNIITGLFLIVIAQSAGAFYCGRDLVAEGDSKLQVLQKCGEPTDHQSRVEYRSIVLRGSDVTHSGVDVIRQEQINIEEWSYDLGHHRFIQLLHFENDRLLSIKELGYGAR
jgi:hypothetical protein